MPDAIVVTCSLGGTTPETVAASKLAMEKGIKRIAFPSISTGVYGFPVKLAAHIAVNVVARFEQEFPKQIEEIYFVLFDRDTEAAYAKEVDKLY